VAPVFHAANLFRTVPTFENPHHLARRFLRNAAIAAPRPARAAVLDDYRKYLTNPIDLLSSREREVLQMLAEGKTNKEIAVTLNLSVYTVDAHRGRIMEKLNVHSINELVRFAVRNGLID